MSIQMTPEQFRAFLDQSGQRVKAETTGDEHVPVRLTLWRRSGLRIGHWLLLGWAILAVLAGQWFSIPVLALFLIAVWDIHHTSKGIEELLAGLNKAGVIDTPTKVVTPPLRDHTRGKESK